jgi:RNA polymerase sigma-B factor
MVAVIPALGRMDRPHPDRPHPDDGTGTAELLRAYHLRGDTTARDRLVELYLPLVETFARRYARSSEEHDDLFQVGCIGLINSIDRFELERGGELAAFAVPNIAGEIRRELRDRGSTVRLPRPVLELRGRVRGAQAELGASLGRAPTTAELAAELGADEQDVALALEAGRGAVPLDPEGDQPVAGEAAEMQAVDDRLMLSDAFRGLDDRARRIVYLRYVRDLEPDDVARELGISRRQLSRDTRAALAAMRQGLERGGAAPAEQPAAPREPAPEPEPAPAAKPVESGGRSGRILLRVPSSLHAELAREADRRGMSLNRFITAALEGRDERVDEPAAAPERRAVLVNVVVLAVLVVAAVVLVVVAVVGLL